MAKSYGAGHAPHDNARDASLYASLPTGSEQNWNADVDVPAGSKSYSVGMTSSLKCTYDVIAQSFRVESCKFIRLAHINRTYTV